MKKKLENIQKIPAITSVCVLLDRKTHLNVQQFLLKPSQLSRQSHNTAKMRICEQIAKLHNHRRDLQKYCVCDRMTVVGPVHRTLWFMSTIICIFARHIPVITSMGL